MVRFREVQRFRQVWVWAVALVPVAIVWYVAIKQLVLGEPLGERPAADWVPWLLLCGIGVGLPLFLASLRLVTEVHSDGVHVRFAPLHRSFRRIGFEEITSVAARDYRPIFEYGGWGIRFGPGGRAYNVRGSRGVQLELQNGKRLLIGSQRADELAAAVGSGLTFQHPGPDVEV